MPREMMLPIAIPTPRIPARLFGGSNFSTSGTLNTVPEPAMRLKTAHDARNTQVMADGFPASRGMDTTKARNMARCANRIQAKDLPIRRTREQRDTKTGCETNMPTETAAVATANSRVDARRCSKNSGMTVVMEIRAVDGWKVTPSKTNSKTLRLTVRGPP